MWQKALFGTANVDCADIYYFKRSVRNVLLVGFHYGLASISDSIVWFFDKTGLKRRIKKLLRARWKRGGAAPTSR